MSAVSAGTRRLPFHHLTIRVPWHDGGWAGNVCSHPLDNSSCLTLPRIGARRRDEVEARCAGRRLDELNCAALPPCVGERVSFMAPFALTRTMAHPYAEIFTETMATSCQPASCSQRTPLPVWAGGWMQRRSHR